MRSQENNRWTRIHVYLSTLFMYMSYTYTLGITARVKKPISIELNLSESFLGFLDSLIFIGGISGYIFIGLNSLMKPVQTLFIATLLLMISLECTILCRFAPTLYAPILIISRSAYGFLRAYNLMPLIILNAHFIGSTDQYLVQIWFAFGMVGETLGLLVTEFVLSTLKLEWPLAITIALSLVLLSSLYMFFKIDEIILNSNPTFEHGFQSAWDFLREYWRSGINILHSILFVLSSTYHLMMLWLPYYFRTIGFQAQGTLISGIYPIAYLLGGLTMQPIQFYFLKHLGFIFLGLLLINNVLPYLLYNLGDDSSEAIQYLIYIFISSLLLNGFVIYVHTTDLKNKVSNPHELLLANSVDRILMQGIYIIHMLVSGIIMEASVDNLFLYYGAIIFMVTMMHILRLVAYPESFLPPSSEESVQEIRQEE